MSPRNTTETDGTEESDASSWADAVRGLGFAKRRGASGAHREAVKSTPRLVADDGLAGLKRGERELRNRILAAGDAARERIERDLHDGAQQRLTALALQLAVAGGQFHERGEAEFGDLLYGFGGQVEDAIDELRALAHGIYPPLLAADGLSAALAAAGRHAAQPVSVATNGIRRYPHEVERAVYFSCVAAMHNAAKHAGRAEVAVHVWETVHALRFSVSDTGSGFDPHRTHAGAGITNMRDRLRAVGGSLTIDSAPSEGTHVLGAVPTRLSASD